MSDYLNLQIPLMIQFIIILGETLTNKVLINFLCFFIGANGVKASQ